MIREWPRMALFSKTEEKCWLPGQHSGCTLLYGIKIKFFKREKRKRFIK